MLATLIQRYDKKSFHFKNERLIYRLSGATFYDCIYTIYQFSKPFLDNKMSVFEELLTETLVMVFGSVANIRKLISSCLLAQPKWRLMRIKN